LVVVGIEYPALNTSDKLIVPLDVIGEPVIVAVSPVGIDEDKATDVTVPLPAPLLGIYVMSDLFILTRYQN
jgi:hypothetical protein